MPAEYSESDSESSSSERQNARGFDGYYKMNRKAQAHKRMRKKRAIPVQPPKVPFSGGTYVSPPEIPMLYQQKMKSAAGDKPRLVAMAGSAVDKGIWFGKH